MYGPVIISSATPTAQFWKNWFLLAACYQGATSAHLWTFNVGGSGIEPA
jgi:hypothetical protein